MKKFEYKKEDKDFTYKGYLAEDKYLAEMGNNGWELTMIKFGRYYYWKREQLNQSPTTKP